MSRSRPGATLRTRVTVVLAAIVAVTALLAAVTCFLAMRASLRGETDDVLREQTSFAKNFPKRDVSIERIQQGMNAVPESENGTIYQFIATDGTTIKPEDAPAIPVTAEDRVTIAGGAGSRRLTDQTIDGEHYRVATVGIDSEQVAGVQVARPLENVDTALSELAWILVLVGGCTTTLAAAATWVLMRPVVAPTEEALADSLAAQRQLVADASHELRTPITSLRTNAELLTRHESLDPATRDQVAQEIVEQSEGLAHLVDDLLDLARDPESQEQTPVRLDEIVSDATDDLRRLYPDVLVIERSAPCLVQGSRPELERVLRNLLENAVVHGVPANGEPQRVAVTLDSRAVLTVRDWGAGISVDELPHVYDRFMRGASSRGRPGSGLGLAIVKQIVEAHRGTVQLSVATDGPGTVAEVRLPSMASVSHSPVARGRAPA